MTHYLLIDTTYLCHRARHAMEKGGGLVHNGQRTEIAFNVLDTACHLLERFPGSRPLWCFDVGAGVRLQDAPGYKGSRRKRLAAMDPKEAEDYKIFQDQMHELRQHGLPDCGYPVYAERGFEADDLIAALAARVSGPDSGDRATIVGSDGDLWQCISHAVRVYNPQTRRVLTRAGFMEKWGLEPCMWANVKALAGCGTDDVPGIAGVGELTASRWFTGKLKDTSRGHRLISENLGVMMKNLPLVQLPHRDTPPQVLRHGRQTPAQWRATCDRYGLRLLRGSYPGGGRVRGVRPRAAVGRGGLGV